MTAAAAPVRERFAALDMARGVAILAMILYHFAWDLGFVGLIPLDVTVEPGWVVFQRAIVSSFLFLTGVSLVLAHGDGIRWPAFWRRFAIVGGAALLVTLGTWLFAPETFVYFGILHAIALFGLMGLLFLRLPLAVVGLIAIFVLTLPLFLQSPAFSERPLSWIGLWTVPPPTEDLVPLFPWLGVVLIGITAMRWARQSGFIARLYGIRAGNGAARALALAGRWSLVIYLVHQPLMLGALLAVTQGGIRQEASRAENFTLSCQASCTETGGQEAFCTSYCACALEEVATRDLWDLLEEPVRSEDNEALLQELVDQCAVRILDESLLAPQ
nr:heparan-alpha-glucosaminide N-acetyltransferase [Pelagibacterium limicola]